MSDGTNVTATYVTLGEAAKRTGLSKTTISRKIKAGEISVREKGDDGAFRIDPAELTRFMDAARAQRATCALETAEPAPVTPPETAIARLEARCEIAEAKLTMAETRLTEIKATAEVQLAGLKIMLDEVKADRDQWREQAQRLALPGPRAERRGLWRWWRRAG